MTVNSTTCIPANDTKLFGFFFPDCKCMDIFRLSLIKALEFLPFTISHDGGLLKLCLV